MAMLSKACKSDIFELRNSLNLSFANIRGLCSNFVDCESFLESNSPDMLVLCETNMDNSIDLAISLGEIIFLYSKRILVLIYMVSQFM